MSPETKKAFAEGIDRLIQEDPRFKDVVFIVEKDTDSGIELDVVRMKNVPKEILDSNVPWAPVLRGFIRDAVRKWGGGAARHVEENPEWPPFVVSLYDSPKISLPPVPPAPPVGTFTVTMKIDKSRAPSVLDTPIPSEDDVVQSITGPDTSEVSKRMLRVCLRVWNMLDGKNRDYGNSALDPVRVFSKAPLSEQIRVRIDDKLSRLSRGSAGGEDVVLDLLGYLVLLKVSELPWLSKKES